MKKEFIITIIYYLILNLFLVFKTQLDLTVLALITTALMTFVFIYIVGLFKPLYRKIVYIASALISLMVIISNVYMLNVKHSVLTISSMRLYKELLKTQKDTLVEMNVETIGLIILFIVYVFLIIKNTSSRRIVVSIRDVCLILVSITLLIAYSFQVNKLLYKYVYDNSRYVEEFGLQSYYFRDVFDFTKGSYEGPSNSGVEQVDEEQDSVLSDKKNVVVVLAESLDYVAINEDTMPTLSMMMEEGMSFSNFYTITTATHGSEYSLLTGLYPHADGSRMYEYQEDFETIPKMFSNEGYCTYGFHANYGSFYDREYVYRDLYEFDYQLFIDDFGQEGELTLTEWPHDYRTFDESVKLIESVSCDKNLSFYMTITGHSPYANYSRPSLSSDYDFVKETYPTYDDPLISYVSSQIQLDKMLTEMVDYYTDAGEIDDTVFIITTDHYPYAMATDNPPYTTYSKAYMNENNNTFDLERAPFVIYAPGEDQDDNETYGSTVDVLPTIADYFGFSINQNLVMGNTLLDDEGEVMWLSTREFSYISNEGYYDGVTGETSFTAEELEELLNEMTIFAIAYYDKYN